MTCRSLSILALAASLAAPCWSAWAQDAAPASVPPDNTGVNAHDRADAKPNAGQQSENSGDLKMAQGIRRALIQDRSLSTYAHNVKVIAHNGSVTLRGPVRSEEEKQAVESKAAEVAGAGNVRSELQVAPPKQ